MKRLTYKRKFKNLCLYDMKGHLVFKGMFEDLKALVEYCNGEYVDIDLSAIDFSHEDLSGVDFWGRRFSYCNFNCCDFTDAILNDCNFDHSTIEGVTWPSEELMTGLDLRRVNRSAFYADQYEMRKGY